jgi:hypothetical protein
MGYVPSLKEKHESKIVGSKAIESKGGSIRYTLQGEYEGRKTLPKTVSKADFEGVYGFDAKAAESAIIIGKNKKGDVDVIAYTTDAKDKTGFTPEKIYFSNVNHDVTGVRDLQNYSNHAETYEDAKDADTVGSPSPATINQPAPSEDPFPQEPSNASFSAPLFSRKYTPQKLMEISMQGEDEEVLRKLFIKTAKKNGLDGYADKNISGRKTLEEIVGTDEYNGIDWQVMVYEMLEMQEKGSGLKGWKVLGWDSKEDMEKAINGAENFSAETKDNFVYDIVTFTQEDVDKNGWEDFYLDGKRENGFDWMLEDRFPTYDDAVKAIGEINKETPLALAHIWEWDKDLVVHTFPDGTKDLGQYTDNYKVIIDTHPDSKSVSEVKEAFGFGKEDEEEESEEPKTQEFTVVMQEGDKLELTDIEEDTEGDVSEDVEPKEEDSPEESENEEKEAESNVRVFVVSSVDYETDGQEDLDLRQDFTFALDKDDIGDTTDMQEIADEIIDDISDETGFLVNGFYFQEKMPDGTMVSLDAESYQAVSAKVTRPVKEDETEDEESEGLSTLAKVGIGLGALAVGAVVLGAEDEGESDYWTGDSASWRAEYVSGAKTFSAEWIELQGDDGPSYTWDDLYYNCPACNEHLEIPSMSPHYNDDFAICSQGYEGDNGCDGKYPLDMLDSFEEFQWFHRIGGVTNEENNYQDPEKSVEDMVGHCGVCSSSQSYHPDNMMLMADRPDIDWDSKPDVYPGQTWYCQGCGSGTEFLIDANKWVAGAESFNAETTMTVEHKDGSKYRYSETDPIYGEMGGIVGHVSEITDEKDTPYQKIYGRDVTRGHNFHLNQAEGFIDQLDHVHPLAKIYCSNCKKEDSDYHYSCGNCGSLNTGLGSPEQSHMTHGHWISRDNFPELYDAESFNAEIFEARLKNQKVFCKEHGMWYKLNHQTGLNQLTRGTGCEGCINKHKGKKAENFSAEGDGLKAFAKKIETEKKKLIKKVKRSGFYENFGDKETRKLADSIPRTLSNSEQDQYFNLVDNFSMWAMNLDLRELEYQSETVGTPSPSGPSSIPEPAEATGSEPSNEQFSAVVDKEFYENVSGSLCPNCGRDGDLGHFSTLYWCDDCGNEGCDGCTDDCDCNSMEAESDSKNLKMALGITAVGIGLAAVLGKDKITKLFDKLGL